MKQKLSAPTRSLPKRPLPGVAEQADKQGIEIDKREARTRVRLAASPAKKRGKEKVRRAAKRLGLRPVTPMFALRYSARSHEKADTVVKKQRRLLTGSPNFDFLASSEVFYTACRVFCPTGSETVNTCSSFSCVSF